MNKNNVIRTIATTAIMAALTFVSTVFISIPYGGGAGYFNLSDSMILFSTIFFGPIVGITSGIIGTVLGDIYLGFAVFAPATLFAKGLEAVLCFVIYYLLRKTKYVKYVSIFVAPIIMVSVYFITNTILNEINYALISLGFDCIQWLAGSIIGFALVNVFERTSITHYSYNKLERKTQN